MNQSFAICLGLSLTFVALGHGCLHHFVAKELPGKQLPIRALFLPRPSSGIAVAIIAFLSALLFLVLAFKVFGGVSSFKAALVFLLFASPLAAHLAWLLSCCRRVENAWRFVPGTPSKAMVRWLLLLPVIATGLFVLTRLRGEA